MLEKEIAREPEIREGLTKIESNIERLENDRRVLIEQLDAYKDLDSQWEKFSADRDATAGQYRVFLANETLAKSLDERRALLAEARKESTDTAGSVHPSTANRQPRRPGDVKADGYRRQISRAAR